MFPDGEKVMINFENLLLIGATGRNTGKTEFVLAALDRWAGQVPIYCLKITSIAPGVGCQRGEHGCGACGLADCAGYVLSEETLSDAAKDTTLFLKRGARKAFWLRSLRSNLSQGFSDFAARVPQDALVICESNSLRKEVKPGLFIMLKNPASPVKPSAQAAISLADAVFINTPDTPITTLLDKIRLVDRIPKLVV
jgi:hypothetical protein